MKRRDMAKERRWIRAQLHKVSGLVRGALLVDGGLASTPRTRRAQTLKIKVAARELARTHTAILLGKGRSK